MIRPKISRKPIFRGQPHMPYETVKSTKYGYKVTPQNSQPQIKSSLKLTDEDRQKLQEIASRSKTCGNNEQE